jgi:hypothetical protein
MDASDTTPAKGESASGGSFPQWCLHCQEEFRYFGVLTETKPVECPECGHSARPYFFWKWYLWENTEPVVVEVRVPTPIVEAADVAEAMGKDRLDFFHDVVPVHYRFVRDGGEAVE